MKTRIMLSVLLLVTTSAAFGQAKMSNRAVGWAERRNEKDQTLFE
jgi:hypothetical protein